MQTGEIIVADVIGKGFYEILDFDEYYVNVKLLKLFGQGWRYKGHITCIHNRPNKQDMAKWDSYKRVHKKTQWLTYQEAKKLGEQKPISRYFRPFNV